MFTVIKTKWDAVTAPEKTNSSEKNWHKLDSARFISELKALLLPLPISLPLNSHTDIDILDYHLLASITAALNQSSTHKVRSFRHKSWWNPVTMLPLRKAAAKARRLAKSHPSEETRATYRSATP